jgi:pimeloyl-ACP methyl ester carboxylesterase
VSFVPAYTVVRAKGSTPTRRAFVLHGILGSGRNWRTFARRLAEARPDTEYVLVDLRNHGDSADAPPPHTVTSAADDLVALAKVVGPPQEVIGHSFGGKVALRYAQRHPEGLQRVWVLDSRASADPPEGDNDVLGVIRTLRDVPQPLASRDELVPLLTGRGFSPMLARWMTTNLRRADDGYRWAFDLDAVDAMIEDYWHLDLWPVLRDPPCRIDVVRAGLGDRWPESVLRRFRVDAHPSVTLHTLPKAGHWLHVDDPDGLLRVMMAA